MIYAMAYILYMGFAWFDWGDKIAATFKKLVHKTKEFTESEEEA